MSLASAFVLAGERLIFRDGEHREADAFLFESGEFRSPDGAASNRDGVVDWWLGGEEVRVVAPQEEAGDEALREALLDYRSQGQAMASKFPGCTGVYIIDDGSFTLTGDLRHLYRYHFVGLILNESLLDWGDISLGFSEGRSRQRLVLARCLTKDGRLTVLDPDDVQIGVPAGDSVHFDPNGRTLSGTIPGVGVGSVIEYVYEYELYSPEDWRLFFPGYYFQMQLPVCYSALTVRVPAHIKLRFWEDNWRKFGKESRLSRLGRWLTRGARRVKRRTVVEDDVAYASYTWAKRDMPPIISEPSMPPWHEVAPAVHASILDSWQHLDSLTGGMQLERIQVTPEIEEHVLALVEDCTTTEEKVARLYHWVQKKVRYISVKSSLSSGWSGHPAAETFAQGYGDCTDKAVLFATMLKVIGVESEPVVLRTNDRGLFVPKYPVLACNHCISEVHLGNGESLFLDCTTQNHRFPALRADDHGVLAINFIRGERRMTPVPPGMEASGKYARDDMELALDGTLSVKSYNRYTGRYEAGLRAGWKRVPEKARSQFMQQYLNGIAPGARLQEFEMPEPQDLDQQFLLEYRYELPAYAVKAGSLRLFQFPGREKTFPEVSLESRRYPLAYTTTEALEREMVLALPEGMSIVELPGNVTIRGKHITYTEQYEIEDRKIRFLLFYERHSRRIPVADYARFRRQLQSISEVTKRPVYFEVTGGA